ncbi:hypothetical protein [Bosea sp. LjRoot237]|uniref:hypothetical protein n=1 Tax=Bosea sp. LjRoot237 TaxID=3342292 RepID=UPI003ECE114F
MQEFIRSPEHRTELTDGDEEYDGSRIKVLKSILGAYWQAAEQQLGEENPQSVGDHQGSDQGDGSGRQRRRVK